MIKVERACPDNRIAVVSLDRAERILRQSAERINLVGSACSGGNSIGQFSERGVVLLNPLHMGLKGCAQSYPLRPKNKLMQTLTMR